MHMVRWAGRSTRGRLRPSVVRSRPGALPIVPRYEARCRCQSSCPRWLRSRPSHQYRLAGSQIAWVVVPDGVLKMADVTVERPGHQARKRPLPIVAATRVPSLNTTVAADTSEPVEPSAMV